jgi:methylmalonyl-CoA mutase
MEFQFKFPDRDLWRAKIISELKENSDRIVYKNEIEQIEFEITAVNKNSFEFSNNGHSNEWKNCFKIEVKDEIQANQICLKALMQGAESLFFEINGSNTDWNKLFKDIQFEYINSRISFSDRNEVQSFENFVRENKIPNINLMIDPLINGFEKKDGQSILLNGFELQQIGANAWQEIGTLLSTFHEILLKDCLKFNFHIGIGQNYFLEIAKIRALKWLCQHLCNTYQLNPEIHFSAEIGFMNKSLKDPHTNLLRQTTEAMAAISGGISELTIRPYDDLSANGSNDFSRRMALNISNILKEESYFDFVKDPLKGSHIIELLTEHIVLKAWDFLRQLDGFKSINEPSKIDHITNCISETRNKRLGIFNQKKLELIGINSFVNSKEEKNAWSNAKSYLSLPYLIFENIV